jgi:hypothetical protein
MVSQATEHGLFVQTYMAERRELGWADEMAAIDINLNEFNIEQELQKQ